MVVMVVLPLQLHSPPHHQSRWVLTGHHRSPLSSWVSPSHLVWLRRLRYSSDYSKYYSNTLTWDCQSHLKRKLIRKYLWSCSSFNSKCLSVWKCTWICTYRRYCKLLRCEDKTSHVNHVWRQNANQRYKQSVRENDGSSESTILCVICFAPIIVILAYIVHVFLLCLEFCFKEQNYGSQRLKSK